jgi:twinkle protein
MKFVDWTYRWKDDEGEDNMHCAKDANQMLMEKGRDAVVWCIEHARKMNIAGLVELDTVESQLDDLYENGLPKAKDLHVAKLNNIFRIEDGLIYLGFAAPGSGKSTMMNFIMMSMVHLYGTHILVYSPEKYPTARHYSEMINVMTGRTFNKGKLIEPAYKRGN